MLLVAKISIRRSLRNVIGPNSKRTKTGASGEYIARIRAVHADVEIDEREHLRKLFTQTSSLAEEK